MKPTVLSRATLCLTGVPCAWRLRRPGSFQATLLLVVLCASAASGGQDKKPHPASQPAASAGRKDRPTIVRGVIVDQDGKPVVGATIGQMWQSVMLSFTPVASNATTDAKGRFEIEPAFEGAKNALFAMDARRARGGILVVDPTHSKANYTLRLEPLVTVTVPVDTSALPDGANPMMYLYKEGCPAWLLGMHVAQNRLTFALPPGSYSMKISDDYCKDVTRAITVPRGQRAVTLEPVALQAGALATYMHETLPPWHITDARGVSKAVKLSDYRGRWVIIEFWAYWCQPCVRFGLPDLMRFQQRHAAQHDQFVILTFHSPDVKDFKTLDPQLQRLRKTVWANKALPFPILLDDTRKTVTRWKVSGYPTTFVVDPAGRLAYAVGGAGPGHTIEAFFVGKLRRPAGDE